METGNIRNNDKSGFIEEGITNKTSTGEFQGRTVENPEGGRRRTVEFFFAQPPSIGCFYLLDINDPTYPNALSAMNKQNGFARSSQYPSIMQFMTDYGVVGFIDPGQIIPLGSSQKDQVTKKDVASPLERLTRNIDLSPSKSIDGGINPTFCPQKEKAFADAEGYRGDDTITINVGQFADTKGDSSNNQWVMNIIERQKAFLREDYWDYLKNNIIAFLQNSFLLVIQTINKSAKKPAPLSITVFLSLLTKETLNCNFHHQSGLLNYNPTIKNIFNSLIRCLIPITKEIKFMLPLAIQGNHSPLLISLEDLLKDFMNNLSTMMSCDGLCIFPMAANAYNLFDMLLTYHHALKDVLDKAIKKQKEHKNAKLEIGIFLKYVDSYLMVVLDKYLNKLYPFAKDVFEYEKSLLSKEVANKLVFPQNYEGRWTLSQPSAKTPSTLRVGPTTTDNLNINTSKDSKAEQIIMEAEIEQAQGIPKKKGGKPTPKPESKKEQTLKAVKALREREVEQAEEKKAIQLKRANVLTTDEMDEVLKNLNPKWNPAFRCLFGNSRESDFKLTTKNVIALAKQIKSAIEITYPEDTTKIELAEALLNDVKLHKHPAHNSTDTGELLPHKFLVIIRQYFLQRGIFPREGWTPTTQEWVHFETFLTAMQEE